MMLLVVGFLITSVWGCSFKCGSCMDGSTMGVCIPRSGGGFNCMSSRSYVSGCASIVPGGRAVFPARSTSGCTRECHSCGGGRDGGVCIRSGSGFNCMSGSSYKRRCAAMVPSRASNECTRECFACRDGGTFGVCIPGGNGFNCMSGSSYKNRCRAMVPSRGVRGSLVAPSREEVFGNDVESFGQYNQLIIGGAVASAFWLTLAVIWKLSSKKPQNEYVEA